MSIIDVDEISDVGLVSQYVVELMGSGHFLSRDDCNLIQEWLKIAHTTDDLLLALEEILPKKIEKLHQQGKRVFSLNSVRKTVEKRINDQRQLLGRTHLR